MPTNLNDGSFSNIRFIVDTQTIDCYKPILIARSEHFKIAFTRFKEKDQTEIEVPNHSYATFMALLKYLYTDSIFYRYTNAYFEDIDNPKSWELDSLIDLLVCADEYQVTRLKAICEVLIADKMSMENCLEILPVSDRLIFLTLVLDC
jgi:speckle-type POZ protein